MFVGSSFGAAFLEPKEVGTLAKVLIQTRMPIFLRPVVRRAVILPQKVGALSKDILQALLRVSQDVSIISVWGEEVPPEQHASWP